jgi:hypothetical protein
MADVLIHRCALHVVRRGGWSWGPDPQTLLAGAMRVLPALIANKLAELWPKDAAQEVATPVRLRLSIGLQDLAGMAGDAQSALPLDELRSRAPWRRLENALEQALQSAVEHSAEPPRPESARDSQSPDALPDPETLWAGTVLSVLLGWQREDRLRSYLAGFSLRALEAWHASLLNAARLPDAATSSGNEAFDEELRNLVVELEGEPLPLPGGRATLLAMRILVVVEAVASLRVSPLDPRLTALLDARYPLASEPVAEHAKTGGGVGDEMPSGGVVTAFAEELTAAGPSAVRLPAPRAVRAASSAGFEMHVASALPYLLLGPLSRTGYLQALGAALEAAGLLAEAASFATALARKVLEPPERGWRRRPEWIAAASAFAGREQPVPDLHLADFAGNIEPHLSLLDAVVGATLADGHRDGAPLAIQRADMADETGLLLCDAEGVFAIAWADRVQRLFPALARFGRATLVVPYSAAAADVLRNLDEAGFRFVTDAPPSRGEDWRRIAGGHGLRAWTNDSGEASGDLLRVADMLEICAAESEALWKALIVQRPAFPAGSSMAAERSLALAAGLALGTVAWTLWREREPVGPTLALERFRDLDGRVRVTRELVRVRLPLGRRFQDLEEHGLLADVDDVPWLGGRRVRFSGG